MTRGQTGLAQRCLFGGSLEIALAERPSSHGIPCHPMSNVHLVLSHNPPEHIGFASGKSVIGVVLVCWIRWIDMLLCANKIAYIYICYHMQSVLILFATMWVIPSWHALAAYTWHSLWSVQKFKNLDFHTERLHKTGVIILPTQTIDVYQGNHGKSLKITID